MPLKGSWGPGYKQEIALVNLVPGALQGHRVETPCRSIYVNEHYIETRLVGGFMPFIFAIKTKMAKIKRS
jgi:hypothetical protein